MLQKNTNNFLFEESWREKNYQKNYINNNNG